MSAARIDVWSDYVCPFCYLAEPTLQRIEQEFADAVEVVWRAFELRPEPVPTLDPKGDYLRDIWASAVYPMARARGMILRLPPVQPRSRLAHEAVAFARPLGHAAGLRSALFRAFFESGEDIGDVNILAGHAARFDLDGAALRDALARGLHREEVLADEALAHRLGVNGVPAMAVRAREDSVEQAVLIEGAQPYEMVRQAVERITGPISSQQPEATL